MLVPLRIRKLTFSFLSMDFHSRSTSYSLLKHGAKDDAPPLICSQSFSLNGPLRRGGCVTLLLKEDMHCELIPDFCVTCDDFEILTARVGKYLFSVCYRPPNKP